MVIIHSFFHFLCEDDGEEDEKGGLRKRRRDRKNPRFFVVQKMRMLLSRAKSETEKLDLFNEISERKLLFYRFETPVFFLCLKNTKNRGNRNSSLNIPKHCNLFCRQVRSLFLSESVRLIGAKWFIILSFSLFFPRL